MLRRASLLAVLVASALVLPALATASVRDDDVRVTGRCSGRSEVSLRVRADDGSLRVEVRIEGSGRVRWRVILLHDRRIALRAVVRAGSSGSVRVRRTFPDWFGRDTIVTRAASLRETCRVVATI